MNTRVLVIFIGLFCFLVGAQEAFAKSAVATTTTASYEITFQSTWDNTTHPDAGFPASAHWSNLVGATHNSSVTFWEAGGTATAGIEAVAEAGSNGTFQSEVNSAITATTADQWINQGFAPFAAISSATIMITVDSDYPLLTLVTMIAPSPDWIAGVSNLSLQDGTGEWIESLSLDLYPYDAGTEDGSTYSTSNAATLPQGTITSLQGIAPFSSASVGTLTITQLAPTAVSLSTAQIATPNNFPWQLVALLVGLTCVGLLRLKKETH